MRLALLLCLCMMSTSHGRDVLGLALNTTVGTWEVSGKGGISPAGRETSYGATTTTKRIKRDRWKTTTQTRYADGGEDRDVQVTRRFRSGVYKTTSTSSRDNSVQSAWFYPKGKVRGEDRSGGKTTYTFKGKWEVKGRVFTQRVTLLFGKEKAKVTGTLRWMNRTTYSGESVVGESVNTFTATKVR